MHVETDTRLILYARDEFGGGHSKTAEGVIRFGPSKVVAVVDRQHAGKTAAEVVGVGDDIPIVATVEEAAKLGADAMLLGCAFVGGRMPEVWREDILIALNSGIDVINGLHDFLADDSEFVAAAKKNGRKLIDLRKPSDTKPIASGKAAHVDALTVLTVGSDCSVGKMTAAIELDREATKRGYKSGFVATGQTGIMIAGRGIAIDRIIGDFMAGAIEELVVESAPNLDMLFIEGQGSVYHPGYSGVTMSLIHGSAPQALVLCHKATITTIGNEGDFPIPTLSQLVQSYELIASFVRKAKVVGICINTYGLPEAEARAIVDQARKSTGLPATDPVRFGVGEILDALEALSKTTRKEAASSPK